MALALLTLLGLPARASELVVNASGFADDAGQAVARLVQPGENVRRAGRLTLTAPIVAGVARFRFADLAPGPYALVVFHDANGNQDIDHNGFGWPQEALGFSGAYRPGLLQGLPTFEKLRFELGESAQALTIRVALP